MYVLKGLSTYSGKRREMLFVACAGERVYFVCDNTTHCFFQTPQCMGLHLLTADEQT
jgi:hypothetical protein